MRTASIGVYVYKPGLQLVATWGQRDGEWWPYWRRYIKWGWALKFPKLCTSLS